MATVRTEPPTLPYYIPAKERNTMGIRWSIAALVLAASPAWAANYATCILDKMPGTANWATHTAVLQTCSHEHPARFSGVKKGSGRGLFGFADGNACIIKKAASTSFQPAATAIASSCRCLYDKPVVGGSSCGNDFDPSTAWPVN